VVFVLEELGVPYEIISFKFDNVKKKPFIDINPNGRVPGKSFLFFIFSGQNDIKWLAGLQFEIELIELADGCR